MEKLKPCPFCGEKYAPCIMEREAKGGINNLYHIECEFEAGGCGARVGYFFWKDEAIEAWNRRANELPTIIEAEGEDGIHT